jgi:Zn-dependent protease
MFQRTLQLGRVLGIRIQLDWSLIVIFLLVVVNLGAGVFPAWHPDWSTPLIWGVAIAAAVVFFLSILIHELSHALVAKAYRIPVESITLFLFGGLAAIEEDPDSPKKEALMAGIGPVTSIALGVIFILLASAFVNVPPGAEQDPTLAFQQMGPLTTLLSWAGPINVLVGLFNLLPGFPLDGGRVLRAALWGITGDVERATRWAARTGQGFAFLLIACGAAMAFGIQVPALGTGLIGGLWLVFIGWFLNGAAVMSYQRLRLRQSLEGVPITQLMRRHVPPAVSADTSIGTLVSDYIMSTGEPLFPVLARGELIGIVRSRDVRRVPRPAWSQEQVSSITTPLDRLRTLRPQDEALHALQTLGSVNEILVLDGDELVGIVSQQEVLRWLELQSNTDAQSGGQRRLAESGR